HWGQLVKQPSRELPRLDLVLLARELVDHRDAHAGVTDPVTELRGEIPLDLLPAQGADPLEERAHLELGAPLGEERPPRAHRVTRLALAHDHLVGPVI